MKRCQLQDIPDIEMIRYRKDLKADIIIMQHEINEKSVTLNKKIEKYKTIKVSLLSP